MRSVRVETQTPDGAVRVVGVLGGEPLETLTLGPGGLAALGFNGDRNKTQLVATPDGPVLLVGLGDEIDRDGLCLAAGAAGRAVPSSMVAATTLHEIDVDGALEAVVTGFLSGAYRYDEYRTSEASDQGDLVLVGELDEAALTGPLLVAEAVSEARDWINRPPVDKAPRALAAEMGERLSAAGFEVEIWDRERIEQERLGGILGVAAGSDRPPRLLVARYGTASPHLALVGKGIVFDSGGLSIKTAEGMETMKSDMAGAAAVVAAASAIGRSEADLRVSVFVPLTDNMSGGSAVKPGDILRTRNGKTIEVLNTDAEGRLVLADALSLAAEEHPDLIVDVATLTGASRVALGEHIAAVFATQDAARQQVEAAAEEAGERVWPMPLPEDYRRLIDSTVADMKNTGGRYGGAIAAALLLAEFVDEVPWAHLDIAGPSWFRDDNPLGPKGASGFGVRTLISLASRVARV